MGEMKNRCCCMIIPDWIDDETKGVSEKTDKWIQEQVIHAKEVMSIPGIYTIRDDAEEEAQRTKMLMYGFPSLLKLKKHELAKLPEITLIRTMFNKLVPFRIKSCTQAMCCCGNCATRCNSRCVQDVIHKVYMKALNIYMGYIPYKDASLEARICYDALTNPKITYQSLCEIVNEFATTNTAAKENLVRKEQLGTTNQQYCYDYAPYVEREGHSYKKVNKETGEVLFDDWPLSGMCPYCLPQTTILTRNRNRSLRRARTALITEKRKCKEDFQLDGKRRPGRPRKG